MTATWEGCAISTKHEPPSAGPDAGPPHDPGSAGGRRTPQAIAHGGHRREAGPSARSTADGERAAHMERAAGSPPPLIHRGYLIEQARLADLPDVARLEAAVFAEPLPVAELFRLHRYPGTRYLVARRAGRVCAYFGFQVFGPIAHVISNATATAHRRNGLAGTLLTAGEAQARQAGARWFLGEVRASNAVQRGLLRALGWRELTVCPRFFGNGEDAVVVMRLFDWPRDGRGGADGRRPLPKEVVP